MKIIRISETKEEQDFAEKAAKAMKENPRFYTFSVSDPQPGTLFAVRWNNTAILILRLHEFHEPACYPVDQFIGGDLPPFEPSF